MLIPAIVLGVLAGAIAFAAVYQRARREAHAVLDAAQREARAVTTAARLEAAARVSEEESAARQETLVVRETALDEIDAAAQAVVDRERAVMIARAVIESDVEALGQREALLDADERERRTRADRASGLSQDNDRRRREARLLLEERAGTSGAGLIAQLGQSWTETARAEAAARLREIEHMAADPATDREAKRVMEIASARCQMHFLTERNISNIRVDPPVMEALTRNNLTLHAALEEIAGVKLLIGESETSVRLDGLDPLGKEVARRALTRLAKKPETTPHSADEARTWANKIRESLDAEVRTLGKKAFQTLGVARAHPEIVELVGALNWRTSYTQNQWLHAVEASFLAGMMAAELGLDEKLARRATLMHDIGKALTHKIEGSHAVIGAEIARRLGESEVVANAIGSHHADEPCNSPYAYLVAAADAMSGARPGARREAAEGFSTKVEDLERIGASYRGVDRAHAVHGGRELRVYVRERELDDLAVVELSSEIAARISEEMTFPGQIKVTVIRAYEAVATAS